MILQNDSKMKKIKLIQKITSILFLLFSVSLIAQHPENTEDSEDDHSSFKKHALSFAISHTHINSAQENPDGSKWMVSPSFCLNYNYNFNHKWAIGLHNDIIIENIDLEFTNEGGKGIVRERPFSTVIAGTYKPLEHLAILLGGGMEFSNHEDFGVVRFGVETPFHIQNNWEIFATLSADISIDNYNSYTAGFGIAKLF